MKPNKPPGATVTRGGPGHNSAVKQRQRLLVGLRQSSVSTLEAREHLSILHPAGRVFELRHRGHAIVTHWVQEASGNGTVHRVGRYVLVPGAGQGRPCPGQGHSLSASIVTAGVRHE